MCSVLLSIFLTVVPNRVLFEWSSITCAQCLYVVLSSISSKYISRDYGDNLKHWSLKLFETDGSRLSPCIHHKGTTFQVSTTKSFPYSSVIKLLSGSKFLKKKKIYQEYSPPLLPNPWYYLCLEKKRKGKQTNPPTTNKKN